MIISHVCCHICISRNILAQILQLKIYLVHMYIFTLQAQPDAEFKFILNYQDHFLKFCILRPLKRKTATATAIQDVTKLVNPV